MTTQINVIKNDGSYDDDRICIIRSQGVHWGSFDVEIHYYPEKPDIYGVWGRETMTNIKPISIGHNFYEC